VPELEVRDLTTAELGAAGAVAGRALGDGPSFRWSAGDEATGRLGAALDLFVGFMESTSVPQIGALLGRHVVGVCGAAPPGACIGAIAPDALRTPPEEVGPPGHESRGIYLWSLYCMHDLDERHSHLGPVSVEPGLQGHGIGAAMLREYCTRVDDEGEVSWLETDKPENVVFYHRHAFEVVEEVERHGLTTWFMRRDPR
jgi:ribosomal protein S18 acetylase RimI-like enzyme